MNEQEKKLDSLQLNFDKILDGLNNHYLLIDSLLSHLRNPLKVDDTAFRQCISLLNEKLVAINKSLNGSIEHIEKLDISKTLGEIKFIGKRLDAIESSIKEIKEKGIKKNIDLQFFVDGYTMVKKPINHEESDPILPSQNDIDILLSESLLKREAKALILRFGLSGHSKHTFDKMGEKMGLSKERCRQIVNKSLRKLRHPSREELCKKIIDKDLRKAIFGE